MEIYHCATPPKDEARCWWFCGYLPCQACWISRPDFRRLAPPAIILLIFVSLVREQSFKLRADLLECDCGELPCVLPLVEHLWQQTGGFPLKNIIYATSDRTSKEKTQRPSRGSLLAFTSSVIGGTSGGKSLKQAIAPIPKGIFDENGIDFKAHCEDRQENILTVLIIKYWTMDAAMWMKRVLHLGNSRTTVENAKAAKGRVERSSVGTSI